MKRARAQRTRRAHRAGSFIQAASRLGLVGRSRAGARAALCEHKRTSVNFTLQSLTKPILKLND